MMKKSQSNDKIEQQAAQNFSQKGVIQSKQGEKPPIRAKQRPIQTKPVTPIKAKQQPVQRNGRQTTGDQLKETMGEQYGVDLSGYKEHKDSSFPQRVGALAAIQGKNIHYAPGQYTLPNRKHELGHAIDNTLNGMPKGDTQLGQYNIDTSREKAADKIADTPLLQKTADIFTGDASMTTGQKNAPIQQKTSSQMASNEVVQCMSIKKLLFSAFAMMALLGQGDTPQLGVNNNQGLQPFNGPQGGMIGNGLGYDFEHFRQQNIFEEMIEMCPAQYQDSFAEELEDDNSNFEEQLEEIQDKIPEVEVPSDLKKVAEDVHKKVEKEEEKAYFYVFYQNHADATESDWVGHVSIGLEYGNSNGKMQVWGLSPSSIPNNYGVKDVVSVPGKIYPDEVCYVADQKNVKKEKFEISLETAKKVREAIDKDVQAPPKYSMEGWLGQSCASWALKIAKVAKVNAGGLASWLPVKVPRLLESGQVMSDKDKEKMKLDNQC